MLSEERTKPVKFVLSPGVLKLAAYSADYGEAEEQMEVQYVGEEITIGFNSRYVLDALGAQVGEQVVLEVKDELSAPASSKPRGRRIPLCYHAYEDLKFQGSGDRVHIETDRAYRFSQLSEPPVQPTCRSLNILTGPTPRARPNLLRTRPLSRGAVLSRRHAAGDERDGGRKAPP